MSCRWKGRGCEEWRVKRLSGRKAEGTREQLGWERGRHTHLSNRTRRCSPLPCSELIPQLFVPIQQVGKTQKAVGRTQKVMEMLAVPASMEKSLWSPEAQQLVSGIANTSPSRLLRFGHLDNVAMVWTQIFNSNLHSAIYFVQKFSQTSSLFLICYFLRAPINPHFSSLPDYTPFSFTTKSSAEHGWILLFLMNGSCTRLDVE